MIPNGEGWHYITVQKLSALLREITSKHRGDFYCLSCLRSFTTKSKGESKYFSNVLIPSEDIKIL